MSDAESDRDDAVESEDAPDSGDAPKKKAKKAKKSTSAKKDTAAKKSAPADDERVPFDEGNHETKMTYGHGGFPKYVMAAWVCFLVGSAAYYYTYGLPDLTAWGSP